MTIETSPAVPHTATGRATADSGDFFLLEKWRGLVGQVYHYRTIALTARDADGKIAATLPLALVKSPFGGRHLTAFPFSDYAPLPADDVVATDLIEQALALNARMRSRYLELRTTGETLLARRDDFVASDLYVRWLLSLQGGADVVWKGVKKSAQQPVKKATRGGVTVRFATSRDDAKTYYKLHLRTRTRKLGMPAQPLRYFLALWDAFAADGTLQILLAEYEGKTIAGIVLLTSGDVVRYAYSASDERYLSLSPNNLLMWSAIRWACEQGYTTFDFGRTARANEGLMQYKRGWGATEEPLTYYYSPKQAGLAGTSEHSWKYRLATGCWRRLPLPLAGPLGGALYRHLG